MRLGQEDALQVEAIPTGYFVLDLALGIGGLPRGRIVEIYGPGLLGKTTLALHCIAEGQKNGGTAAFSTMSMRLIRFMHVHWALM